MIQSALLYRERTMFSFITMCTFFHLYFLVYFTLFLNLLSLIHSFLTGMATMQLKLNMRLMYPSISTDPHMRTASKHTYQDIFPSLYLGLYLSGYTVFFKLIGYPQDRLSIHQRGPNLGPLPDQLFEVATMLRRELQPLHSFHCFVHSTPCFTQQLCLVLPLCPTTLGLLVQSARLCYMGAVVVWFTHVLYVMVT